MVVGNVTNMYKAFTFLNHSTACTLDVKIVEAAYCTVYVVKSSTGLFNET